MNKISLIIQREYLTRVKKKSFIIMTFLGPILFGALFAASIWFGYTGEEKQNILVVDELGAFQDFKETSNISFTYSKKSLEAEKAEFFNSTYNGILYIPQNVAAGNTALLFFKKQPGFISMAYFKKKIEEKLENLKIKAFEIDPEKYYAVKTDVHLNTIKFSEPGKEEKTNQNRGVIGFIFAIMIYFFIFLYGMQVMRGVMEEKSNRIVEVIISSVKPFQLMAGKIVGVALVGLTQFLLWVALTGVISTAAQSILMKDKYDITEIGKQINVSEQLKQNLEEENKAEVDKNEILAVFQTINFPLMLGAFLFYFLGGYLLYSALFAAIGAAVDNETDTQQFMMPVTLPLVLGFIVSQAVMQNPESPIAFWFSIIPFTSPVVMMVRLAFEVPMWQLFLSAGLLIAGFFASTWLAAKIYRTGILMYGKKVTYKELWRWINFKG